MMKSPADGLPDDVCRYVKRNTDFCGRKAVVVFDVGQGVGVWSCVSHVWQRLSWAQNGDRPGGRYDQGDRSVVAVPAHMWEDYKEYWADLKVHDATRSSQGKTPASLRQALTDILIQHQCMSDSGCSCGDVRLGASYADHVAGKLLPEIEEHIAMDDPNNSNTETGDRS